MRLTQKALAAHIGIPVQRIKEIVRGKRGISAEIAWLLSGAFNTSPEFWLNLQASYDLSLHRPTTHVRTLGAANALDAATRAARDRPRASSRPVRAVRAVNSTFNKTQIKLRGNPVS